MDPIIKLCNVSKEFKVLNRHPGILGSVKDLFSRDYNIVNAVNNVNVEIMPGEVVGYLGPNGAGKSTTIKMMTGVLKPTSGEVLINGVDPFKSREKLAENIGVVFGQRTQLWWALPLIESFKVLKEMYFIDDDTYNTNLKLFNELVGVEKLYSKLVRQMSLGQRTLCDILAAFLHDPKVVFLDEPTIGLDVSMKAQIRELILTLNEKKNTTVILTTHDMGDVDTLCKRIVIIDKGKQIYDNSIENLQGFFGKYRTLKLMISGEDYSDEEAMKKCAHDIEAIVKAEFPQAVSLTSAVDEHWIDLTINEEEAQLMKIMSFVNEKVKITDVKIQEISTENVIKGIYERRG